MGRDQAIGWGSTLRAVHCLCYLRVCFRAALQTMRVQRTMESVCITGAVFGNQILRSSDHNDDDNDDDDNGKQDALVDETHESKADHHISIGKQKTVDILVFLHRYVRVD